MESDYTNNGVSLLDAAGNSGGMTLFAYIGPCISVLSIPPEPEDWDPAGSGYLYSETTNIYPTNLTYSYYITNTFTTTTIDITRYVNPYYGWWNGWLGVYGFYGDWFDGRYGYFSCYFNLSNPDMLALYEAYWSNILGL